RLLPNRPSTWACRRRAPTSRTTTGTEPPGEGSLDAPVVEFFFSPGSRYSYLAASRIPELESRTGCRVVWRPVDGREIRRLRGRDPFTGPPASGQYDERYRETDARRWADYYGIPFREPGHDLDFALLVRAATAAGRLGAAAAYGWRLCAAVYGSDAWPVDDALCTSLAADTGLDPRAFRDVLHDP